MSRSNVREAALIAQVADLEAAIDEAASALQSGDIPDVVADILIARTALAAGRAARAVGDES